jgi:hypothetical protein
MYIVVAMSQAGESIECLANAGRSVRLVALGALEHLVTNRLLKCV